MPGVTMSSNGLHSYEASHVTLVGKDLMASVHKPDQKLEIEDSPLLWQSPWILPAYVISNEQDAEKRPTVKIAKCIIDTGNMQGNIVSRRLVEVLGFSSSSFEQLTEEEGRGGSGITGDSHIPQGAIYLTWYHNNSTRVFRDMRFLISPSESYDMIVGAWSIQKDKILDVPCLPLDPKPPKPPKPSQRDPVEFTPEQKEDVLLRNLGFVDHRVRKKWQARTAEKAKNKKKDKDAMLEKLAQESEAEVDVTGWLIRVYDIWQHEGNNAQSLHEAAEIWKELDINWHMMRNEPPEEIQNELEQVYQHLKKKLNLKDEREEGKKNAQELNKI